MIELSPTIKKDFARAFQLARQDRFRIVWLEDNLAYCARRKRGHGQYLVRIFVVQGIDGQTKVRMRCNMITGAPCKGTEFNDMCSHIAAVILRGQYGKAKQRRERAA